MKHFHVHIYFEDRELEQAHRLQQTARFFKAFDKVKLEKKAIGPHPSGMIELHFWEIYFSDVTAWLETNRGSFTAMIHEDTGDDFKDHTDGIHWLGPKKPLDFSFFELILKRPELKIHP